MGSTCSKSARDEGGARTQRRRGSSREMSPSGSSSVSSISYERRLQWPSAQDTTFEAIAPVASVAALQSRAEEERQLARENSTTATAATSSSSDHERRSMLQPTPQLCNAVSNPLAKRSRAHQRRGGGSVRHGRRVSSSAAPGHSDGSGGGSTNSRDLLATPNLHNLSGYGTPGFGLPILGQLDQSHNGSPTMSEGRGAQMEGLPVMGRQPDESSLATSSSSQNAASVAATHHPRRQFRHPQSVPEVVPTVALMRVYHRVEADIPSPVAAPLQSVLSAATGSASSFASFESDGDDALSAGDRGRSHSVHPAAVHSTEYLQTLIEQRQQPAIVSMAESWSLAFATSTVVSQWQHDPQGGHSLLDLAAECLACAAPPQEVAARALQSDEAQRIVSVALETRAEIFIHRLLQPFTHSGNTTVSISFPTPSESHRVGEAVAQVPENPLAVAELIESKLALLKSDSSSEMAASMEPSARSATLPPFNFSSTTSSIAGMGNGSGATQLFIVPVVVPAAALVPCSHATSTSTPIAAVDSDSRRKTGSTRDFVPRGSFHSDRIEVDNHSYADAMSQSARSLSSHQSRSPATLVKGLTAFTSKLSHPRFPHVTVAAAVERAASAVPLIPPPPSAPCFSVLPGLLVIDSACVTACFGAADVVVCSTEALRLLARGDAGLQMLPSATLAVPGTTATVVVGEGLHTGVLAETRLVAAGADDGAGGAARTVTLLAIDASGELFDAAHALPAAVALVHERHAVRGRRVAMHRSADTAALVALVMCSYVSTLLQLDLLRAAGVELPVDVTHAAPDSEWSHSASSGGGSANAAGIRVFSAVLRDKHTSIMSGAHKITAHASRNHVPPALVRRDTGGASSTTGSNVFSASVGGPDIDQLSHFASVLRERVAMFVRATRTDLKHATGGHLMESVSLSSGFPMPTANPALRESQDSDPHVDMVCNVVPVALSIAMSRLGEGDVLTPKAATDLLAVHAPWIAMQRSSHDAPLRSSLGPIKLQ